MKNMKTKKTKKKTKKNKSNKNQEETKKYVVALSTQQRFIAKQR